MSGFALLFRVAAGLLSLGVAVAAAAAPAAPDANAKGKAFVAYPASLQKLYDLNFAYLTVTTVGTAVIDPNTDAMTTTGGVIHVGGTPFAARFEAVSPTSNVVIIRIPKNPITLTRFGGTETMTVSNWTMSGNSRRTVARQEPFEFKVGGTLYVNANQAEGTYIGNFDVEIQYP